MRYRIIIILCLWTLSARAQYFGGEAISKKDFRPWNVDTPEDYSRLYQFGFSEGECSFKIIVLDTIYVAQAICYEWRENIGFVSTYRTFTDVKIEGNKFYSAETKGEFVLYQNADKFIAGLYIYDPWTYQFYEGGEFGAVYSEAEEINLPGKFSIASLEVLDQEYLKGFEKEDLKFMRNEIFARYGYKFIEGGEMENYFKSEKWYRPTYDDVNGFLTIIEKHNIESIMEVEKNRTATNPKN